MEKEPKKAEPRAPPRTNFNLHDLPTSSDGLIKGDVWNNRGVLNIIT